MPKLFDSMRKKPVQNRGQHTVDILFEATAQLLDKASAEDVNTNQIAERAGFSIGTLYSYFPNKKSLVREMALNEIRLFEARYEKKVETLCHKTPEHLIRALIQLSLTPLKGSHRVRRKLFFMIAPDQLLLSELDQALNRMTDRFLELAGINKAELTTTRRFLLLRSLLGPIRAATLQAPELLTRREFEDDLVMVTLAILGIPASQNLGEKPIQSADTRLKN